MHTDPRALPKKLDYIEGETPASFLSRLAMANGSNLSELASILGIKLGDVIDGELATTEWLAQLGGVEPIRSHGRPFGRSGQGFLYVEVIISLANLSCARSRGSARTACERMPAALTNPTRSAWAFGPIGRYHSFEAAQGTTSRWSPARLVPIAFIVTILLPVLGYSFQQS